ncbi:MAG: D-ribose transport system ATP-binding protein [Marmoricola sp.]|jgi:ABC-type sugar transport system ATPase subunit|nr:D-ribose transport system ATP-binding protein [Marmoricola sp.]
MTSSVAREPGPVQFAVRGLGKSYPGTRALADLDLDLVAGEVHGIAGQNGAGKSTLVRIMSGVEKPDTGSIVIDGARVRFDSPQDAQRAQIYTVHQELSLMAPLSVAENIFMGDLKLRPGRWVDWAAVRREASEGLRELGIDIDVRRPVSSLPIGHRQLVEIAKAVRRDARVLLLDEPTATLPAHEAHRLFTLVETLKERGIAIVYISHHFDEMYEICDRISVFRDGRKVAEHPAEVGEHNSILRAMLGKKGESTLRLNSTAGVSRIGEGAASDEVVLQVKDLRSDVLRDVSLSLRRGEVLGVSGLLGNGQSELSAALFGATEARSSEFVVNGRSRHPRHPAEAIALGIGLLPEERKSQGLVLSMSVTSNVTMAALGSFTRSGLLQRGAERRAAARMRTSLAIKASSTQQPVATLSGGNQQKVALAKWLVSGVQILIFAEPTRGVDVGAKAEIYGLIGEFVRAGGSVIVLTSEISEALMCDRVLVMRRGALVGEVDRDAIEDRGEDAVMDLFS